MGQTIGLPFGRHRHFSTLCNFTLTVLNLGVTMTSHCFNDFLNLIYFLFLSWFLSGRSLRPFRHGLRLLRAVIFFYYSPCSYILFLDVLWGRPDKGCVRHSRHLVRKTCVLCISVSVCMVYFYCLFIFILLSTFIVCCSLWRCFSPHVC